MSEEKLVYQYLQSPNEDDSFLGKIVYLKSIDDVSDPEMSFYIFSDGFKCNSKLIGQYGEVDAFTNGKILVRVPDEKNIWSIKKSEAPKPSEKSAIGDDENVYQAADPYFFDKNGNFIGQNAKSKCTATPCFYKHGVSKDIPDKYFMSFSDNKEKEERLQEETIQDLDERESRNGDAKLDNAISDVEQPKLENSIIDFDKLEVIKVILDGKPIELIKSDLNDFLNGRAEEEQACIDSTDPIAILLKSCKKYSADVEMTVGVDLPAKSFVSMVIENYGEENKEKLIGLIVDSLGDDLIRKALKDALSSFYSESSEQIEGK